jgi:signal transduction histidine kinase
MNLLDISKMETGKMPLNMVSVSIPDVILKKTEELKIIANQKDIKFKFHFMDNLPYIKADVEILKRLIANLVNNAISYSKAGSVISITATKEETFLKVKIKDTGKGIPKQFQSMIFDKYGQVNEGVRRYGSTGLGLTFCKMAVEAHGGTIGVFSEEEKGSEFFFSLPTN